MDGVVTSRNSGNVLTTKVVDTENEKVKKPMDTQNMEVLLKSQTWS